MMGVVHFDWWAWSFWGLYSEKQATMLGVQGKWIFMPALIVKPPPPPPARNLHTSPFFDDDIIKEQTIPEFKKFRVLCFHMLNCPRKIADDKSYSPILWPKNLDIMVPSWVPDGLRKTKQMDKCTALDSVYILMNQALWRLSSSLILLGSAD